MCIQFGTCCLFCARGDKHPDLKSYRRRGEVEHVSYSNGVIGGKSALDAAVAMDVKLGVADKIAYRPIGNGAYAAVFSSAKEKAKWMKAHKRVDTNGGYGDPCPGDFRRNTPGEFD